MMDVRQLPTAYAAHLLGRRKLQRLMSEENLLHAGGMPRFIDKADFWRLCIRNIVQTEDESHGIGRQPVGTWSTICGAVNQMETVGDGIVRFAELTAIAPIGMIVSVGRSRRGVQVTFGFSPATRSRIKAEIYCELMAMVFHCSLVWMADRTFFPSQTRLSEHLAETDGCFLSGMPCRFDRQGAGVTLTYSPDAMTLPLGQRRYQRWNAHEPLAFEALLDAVQFSQAPAETAELGRLKVMLQGEAMSQGEVARSLGMSSATLRRKLSEADTSFRSLSRDIRAARLQALLQSNMMLDDIAVALGLSDRRSLCRASHQWLGMSPATYRQRHKLGLERVH